MIVTASPRLPFSQAWSFSRAGHVAITIKDAQIMENKKGRRIQKLDIMSIPMKITARVVCVTSMATWVFGFI
jgi:hypothetical protein